MLNAEKAIDNTLNLYQIHKVTNDCIANPRIRETHKPSANIASASNRYSHCYHFRA